jgi:hypothetical protein
MNEKQGNTKEQKAGTVLGKKLTVSGTNQGENGTNQGNQAKVDSSAPTINSPVPDKAETPTKEVKAMKKEAKVTEGKAVTTKRTKAEKPVRPVRLVPGTAKRALTLVAGKAEKKVQKTVKTVTQQEQDALESVKQCIDIVGTELHKEGKLTPFGHMVNRQNGKFDMAIIEMAKTGKLDFGSLVRKVQEGDQTGRRSSLEDNKAMVLRVQDHCHWLAGRTHGSLIGFPKRLSKVGKEKDAKMIMGLMFGFSELFDEYVRACEF